MRISPLEEPGAPLVRGARAFSGLQRWYPARSAISSYDRPSTCFITNASRNDGASVKKRTIEIRAKLGPVQLLIGSRIAGRLIVFIVAQVRAPNVLQPVLAPVCYDPENPGVEASAHLSEVLVRLDERHLENVFRNIRAAGHAQRVPVQWVAIPVDQGRKRISVARKDSRMTPDPNQPGTT